MSEEPAATYRPDHNGECLNCDEPMEAHHAPDCPAFERTVDDGCVCDRPCPPWADPVGGPPGRREDGA
jgi:hypothetical protein